MWTDRRLIGLRQFANRFNQHSVIRFEWVNIPGHYDHGTTAFGGDETNV